MVQVAKLSADLYANTTRFETGMKKASGILGSFSKGLDKSLGKNARSFNTFNSRVSSTNKTLGLLQRQIVSFAGVAASAFSVNRVIKYADTFKELEGRLRVATDGVGDLATIQKELFEVSQKNSAPLKDVIDAYSRLSLSLSSVQKQKTDLVQVTDLLSKTLLVSGTNAAGAATFFQQFGQAASSDFQAIGQEVQTFADQNAFFIKILQENLNTGGRSIKEFAADGELSFDLIAKALIDGSDRINEAVETIPETVGKALQKLDNAFLKLIGQSGLANKGVSSLALGINSLANNLGTVTKAIGVLAAITGGRLLASLVATTAAYASNTLQVLAYQAALSRMAGLSLSAAAGQTALAGSLGLVSRALALVGGPIGAAFITATYLWSQGTNSAKDAQDKLNDSMSEFSTKVAGYATASKGARQSIVEDTKARIKGYIEELKAIEKIRQALADENFISRGARRLGSKLGVDTSVEDVENLKDSVSGAIVELEQSLENFKNIETGAFGGNSEGANDNKKSKYQEILDGLKEETEELKIQTDLQGKKETLIDRTLKKAEIERQLREDGIVLTEEQNKIIDEYLGKIEAQTEALEDQSDATYTVKDAVDDLGGSFATAFEDAIIQGEGLRGVLAGLLKDIQRVFIKNAVTKPLGDLVGGLFEGSGNGILSSIGGMFSAATGMENVPYDTVMRVHKGESVVTRQQAEKMRSGASGGGVINIDARGAEAGVEQKIRAVMADVTALRKEVPTMAVSSVKNAQNRGKM